MPEPSTDHDISTGWLALITGLVILAMLLIGALAQIQGIRIGTDTVQHEAILKGHARWAVDKEGRPVFRWNPTPEEKQDEN